MTPQEFERSLNRASSELQGETMRKLAKVIGNRAVQLFKQNFLDEGFFGRKWKEVKRRLNPKTKGADASRRILTGRTGNLGRSIQATPKDHSVEISSDLPYAAAHNDGTTTAGRGNRTTIPQRQFIGPDPAIDRMVEKEIDQALQKLLK